MKKRLDKLGPDIRRHVSGSSGPRGSSHDQSYVIFSFSVLLSDTICVSLCSQVEFPKRPGTHLTMTDPALEFVKMVCRVMSLEPSIETEVGILKGVCNLGSWLGCVVWCVCVSTTPLC